jgi:hypothetical protein
MQFSFFILSQNFYKFATDIDVAQRLRTLDSWDGVTDVAISGLFFQELKNKPGEHKDKIKATKLLLEIKKTLSAFRSNLVGSLNSESYSLFISPGSFDYYFDNLDSLINRFRPLVKSFGGSDSFQDEQLKKFFRSMKIYLNLRGCWYGGQRFPIKLYSELIYVNEDEILEKFMKKIELVLFHILEYIRAVQGDVLDFFTRVCYVAEDVGNTKNDVSVTEDKLKEIVEDYDNYEKAIEAAKNFVVQFFKLDDGEKIQILNTGIWKKFDKRFERLYNSSVYEKKKRI